MLGASVTVLAAEMGSITVEGAVEGVDYSIYRIFDLESFSSEGGGTGRYAYKLSEKWNGFSAGEYFTVDENEMCIRDRRHIVAALDDVQPFCLLRQHHIDPVYLIGKRLFEHVNIKKIALLQLIQIGKKMCIRDSLLPLPRCRSPCAPPHGSPHSCPARPRRW